MTDEELVAAANRGDARAFELRARIKTFLYPVVRHNAIAAAAKRRQAGEPLMAEPPAHDTPEMADREHLEDLDRILSTLPDGQREVLILRFVDELRLEEIATAMELPLGTVKSRLHHALARIRERGSF